MLIYLLDAYKLIISAEIPDQKLYPKLYQLVKQHMDLVMNRINIRLIWKIINVLKIFLKNFVRKLIIMITMVIQSMVVVLMEKK